MMIPIDNRLKQPPNGAWHSIAARPPCGEQIVFTDAAKQFVWIGSVSCNDAPLPALPATGQIGVEVAAAFWSSVADQA